MPILAENSNGIKQNHNNSIEDNLLHVLQYDFTSHKLLCIVTKYQIYWNILK